MAFSFKEWRAALALRTLQSSNNSIITSISTTATTATTTTATTELLLLFILLQAPKELAALKWQFPFKITI